MRHRLRRYQFYFSNERVHDRFCGFLEGWDLDGRDALQVKADESFDGVTRYLRGNVCETGTGEILRAVRVV